MQTFTPEFQAELDKGRDDPRILVDLYEFYPHTYVPGPTGFDPTDAIETFAAQEITWNGIAYRREVKGRGDIVKSTTEKTNSVTVEFSGISRYMATLAQSQTIEGMFLVIRCVSPTVTNDSAVEFTGKCEKPSDIDKQEFTLSARQDFGNINQTLPPRKFTAQDPEGRHPSDPLFEGIQFIAVAGSNRFNTSEPQGGIGGLFGRHRDVEHTRQWSSVDGTPYGQVINEIFGRCQMRLIPFAWADKGLFVTYLMAISGGPIGGATEIKSRTEGFSDPYNLPGPIGPVIHLGDPGGTGTNTGNTNQADLGAGGKFSHLAYIEGASDGSLIDQDDTPPTVTALVRGRVVPLPDSSGVYNQTGWTDNNVHIARFILTHPSFVNIDPAFMEDPINYRTALHCDAPLIDETNDQMILIQSPDLGAAGDLFSRYRATGIINPRYHLYYDYANGIEPEFVDGPYDDWTNPTSMPTFAIQKLLRKRYTCNLPITDEVRAVDLLYKTIFPSFKGYLRINKYGRYEIHTEKPSDNTYLRAATAVGDTSLPILDVTPWKTWELLTGRLLLGFGLLTAEVRNVSSAVYSTSGNSITLSASKTGTIVITASGANLTGGSTTVQASGTITLSGTLTVGDTITTTIDGIAVTYILGAEETLNTAASMLAGYINATPRLQKYIQAVWTTASPTVITIKCLHGALNLVAPLLHAHIGPVPDPSAAPTVAAASGALLAGTYKVAYADVRPIGETAPGIFVYGETALTPLASVTLSANQQINVSSLPAFPATVTSRNFYISEVHDSTVLKFAVNRSNTSNFSINALPLPGASLPPSFNKTSEELMRIAMSFSTNSQDVLPPWPVSTPVILNDVYLPTVPNGHKYRVSNAGTTGTTEPTWPTSAGGTVASGGAEFTEIGPTYLGQSGLTRANVKKGTFKWPLGSRQASVNQIKINYRSAKDDFALVPYRVNDPVHQAQVKKVYPLEVDGSAIDNFHQMYRIANWKLAVNREGDWFDSLATGPQGLVLEEGDLICASDDSGGLVNVVTRIEELRIHANHDVTISQARKYSTNMFSDDVRADPIPIATTLRFTETVDSVIEFIDTAPIKESDSAETGFQVAVSRPIDVEGDWRGWALYVDFGDGYIYLVEGDIAATMGTATSTLASVDDWTVYDTVNTVTFTVEYGARPISFTDATQANLDANPHRNLFLVGDEYIQAATITDNGSDSYTLSNLYRGRYFTETEHASGERVVYMDGAEAFVPTDISRVGISYNYKAVTTNQDVADATAVPFTWLGSIRRPRRMSDAFVVRDSSHDWLITAVGHPRSYEIPANYSCQFWASEGRTSPATNLKLTLPMVTGTAQAALLATSVTSFVRPGSGGIGISSWALKNNFVSGFTGGDPSMGTTYQALTETFQRFDFEMANGFGAAAFHASFEFFRVGLHERANADAPYTTPDLADCPVSVEWTVPVDYYDTYPQGTVRETYRKYSTILKTLDGVDPGQNPCVVIDGEVVESPINGRRPGQKITFLVNGNEIIIYKNYSPSTRHTLIAKVAMGKAVPYPLRLSMWSEGDYLYVRNIMYGGAIGPSTILSYRDQMEAFGALQTRLYLRLFQDSRYLGLEGFPLDVVTPLTNYALASHGGTATASSEFTTGGYNMVAAKAINGDRTGAPTTLGVPTTLNTWHSAGATPDHWLEVNFGTSRTIEQIDVIGLQDNLLTPGEPTLATTFTLYGLQAFDVQYWNGSSWVTVTGGTVTGNNLVWKQFTFTPVSATKVRVLIHTAPDGYGRIVELEAWG